MTLSLKDANEFILKFVNEFRRRPFLKYKPSTRQSISMSSLLSTIYFKRGYLTTDDLIRVAVSTTPPLYQEEALRVASKVIFKSKERKNKSLPNISIPSLALPFMWSLIPLGLFMRMFKFMKRQFNFNRNIQGSKTNQEKSEEIKGSNKGVGKAIKQNIITKKNKVKEVNIKGRITSSNLNVYRSGKLFLKRRRLLSHRFLLKNFKSLFGLPKHRNGLKLRKLRQGLVKEGKMRYGKSNFPSLDAGPGENLLRDWYELRNILPKKAREEMKEVVKDILIEWSDARAKLLIGTNKVGVLPSHVVKPCYSHDLLEYVDLEETIENLLSKCKKLTEITYEDLVIRVPERGNNAIVLLLDASGSMAGEKLATMVVSAVVMLKVFSKDGVALAVFESDVFRVKEVDEYVEIDDIVDMLLDLEPLGGTCISRALLWAEEQFEKSLNNTRILVIFSDLAFYDYVEAEFVLRRMIEGGITVFIVVPKLSYDTIVASSLERLGAIIVEVVNWREVITFLLERVYSS